MFNFIIKTAKAQIGPTPSMNVVPTIGGVYDIFIKALNWFFAFSIIIAIVLLIMTGIRIFVSGGDSESRKNSLSRLYWIMVGVGIVFLAWIIVTKIIPGFLGVGEVTL